MGNPIEVIVTNLKRRHSGVSSTIFALLPWQRKFHHVGYWGAPHSTIAPACSRSSPGGGAGRGENSPNRNSRIEPPNLVGTRPCQIQKEVHGEEAQLSPGQISSPPPSSPQPVLRWLGGWHALTTSFAKPPPGRPCRIWHVRRDHEMVFALLVRWLSRGKIKIVFTSAAQRYHGRFVRWITGKVDAVVATSKEAAAFCPRVAAIIGHGVDCERFHPVADKSHAWREAGLPGAFGLGVFGRVREEKGTDVFVAAMLEVLPEFPAATALIVGDCLLRDQAFKERLVKKIRAAGLAQRFVWTGYIPNEQIQAWYQRTAVAVACPRYEGYGLTLFEAAACGCAVVGSNTGAFPLLIEEGKTGFLTGPGDVNSLSRALRMLLSDAARMKTLGEAAREKVAREFSVEREARQLAKLYDELLTGQD